MNRSANICWIASIWLSGSGPILRRIAALNDAIGIPEIAQQISEPACTAPSGVRPSESEASTRLARIAETAARVVTSITDVSQQFRYGWVRVGAESRCGGS